MQRCVSLAQDYLSLRNGTFQLGNLGLDGVLIGLDVVHRLGYLVLWWNTVIYTEDTYTYL